MNHIIDDLTELHQDMMRISQEFQHMHERIHAVMNQLQQQSAPVATSSYGAGPVGFAGATPSPYGMGGTPNQPVAVRNTPNTFTKAPGTTMPYGTGTGMGALRQETASAASRQPSGAGSPSYYTNAPLPSPLSQMKSPMLAQTAQPGMAQSMVQGIKPDQLQGRQSETTLYGRI